MTEYLGYWDVDAPLTPEEQNADMAILAKFQVPEGMTLKDCTVWVHGREWRWRSERVGIFR